MTLGPLPLRFEVNGRPVEIRVPPVERLSIVLRDHLGVPATILSNTVFPSSVNAPPMGNLIKASSLSSRISSSPGVAPPADGRRGTLSA